MFFVNPVYFTFVTGGAATPAAPPRVGTNTTKPPTARTSAVTMRFAPVAVSMTVVASPLPRSPPKPSARRLATEARNVSGWPKICKLAHAFVWKYSYL